MNTINYRFVYWVTLIAVGIMGHLLLMSGSVAKESYEHISVEQFVAMMNHKDFILINVHVPYEGEIPGTDLVIPFNAIDRHRDKLPKDKDAKIVVYCMTGPMGEIAARTLASMEYTKVFNLQGGMEAWRKTGRSLLFRPK